MQNNFNKLHAHLKGYFEGKEYFYALKALNFAKQYHTGTRKDGKTPEIQHQYEMCLYAISLNYLINEELILTAILLHDIQEDYDIDKNQIYSLLGNSPFTDMVVSVVWKLTKKYKGQTKNPYDYFNEIEQCPYASLVKGIDRIHNMRTMVGVFTKEKCSAYKDETVNYFLPMIKKAKNTFPKQYKSYLNIEQMLKNQIEYLNFFLKENFDK